MRETKISKAEVRGTASGIFFMAFFGTAWAGIGIGGLQGWGFSWLLPLALLIGAVLLICSLTLIWASRGLSNDLSEADARRKKRLGIGFGITFGTEFVLIGAAGVVCNATNHFEFFFPVMALIVGVHFFPLAYLFQVRIHYVAGGLLCLLAVVTLLFVPEKINVGQHQIIAWGTILGFGSAFILWGTGVVIWFIGRKLLNITRYPEISNTL